VYCSKCGSLVEDGVAFCPKCGQPTLSTAAALPASSQGVAFPIATQTVAPIAYAHSSVQYAGFWLRLVAYLIDSAVLGLGFMALFIPFAMMTGLFAALGQMRAGEDPRDVGAVLGGTFFLGLSTLISLSVLGTWLYHAKMESSLWQATLGKKALNLRVTDFNGAPISFARATGRHFAKFITSLIPLGIGYALAGFTERKQAVHDIIASCLVLRDT
jgi:uncharacterized RDD family membrane protein YckC